MFLFFLIAFAVFLLFLTCVCFYFRFTLLQAGLRSHHHVFCICVYAEEPRGSLQNKESGFCWGSGSAPHDDVVEFAAPQETPAPVTILDLDTEVVKAIEIGGGAVPKKRKISAVKPLKGKEPLVGKVVCNEVGKGPDGGPVRIGLIYFRATG